MSKLSNILKMMLLKKDVYDKLVANVNNVDTSRFVLRINTDKSESKNKIPGTCSLLVI